MTPTHRRHDISDRVLRLIEPHLPGRAGVWGGTAKDNRLFINAVFWIIRTGAPWRDLPPDYGNWSNTHRRFICWGDKGIWEKLLEILIDEPDYEWLMIDASHCKVHPHAAGTQSGNQDMSRTKGAQYKDTSGRRCAWYAGQNCYHAGYTRADCTQADRLVEGINADHLIADKGYDTDAIRELAATLGMNTVIPSKKNLITQRPYDKCFYKLRHLAENAFLHLKRWRGTPHSTQKTPHPSSPQFKSDALPSELISREYNI